MRFVGTIYMLIASIFSAPPCKVIRFARLNRCISFCTMNRGKRACQVQIQRPTRIRQAVATKDLTQVRRDDGSKLLCNLDMPFGGRMRTIMEVGGNQLSSCIDIMHVAIASCIDRLDRSQCWSGFQASLFSHAANGLRCRRKCASRSTA